MNVYLFIAYLIFFQKHGQVLQQLLTDRFLYFVRTINTLLLGHSLNKFTERKCKQSLLLTVTDKTYLPQPNYWTHPSATQPCNNLCKIKFCITPYGVMFQIEQGGFQQEASKTSIVLFCGV